TVPPHPIHMLLVDGELARVADPGDEVRIHVRAVEVRARDRIPVLLIAPKDVLGVRDHSAWAEGWKVRYEGLVRVRPVKVRAPNRPGAVARRWANRVRPVDVRGVDRHALRAEGAGDETVVGRAAGEARPTNRAGSPG